MLLFREPVTQYSRSYWRGQPLDAMTGARVHGDYQLYLVGVVAARRPTMTDEAARCHESAYQPTLKIGRPVTLLGLVGALGSWSYNYATCCSNSRIAGLTVSPGRPVAIKASLVHLDSLNFNLSVRECACH
jgi:hypothetical protein